MRAFFSHPGFFSFAASWLIFGSTLQAKQVVKIAVLKTTEAIEVLGNTITIEGGGRKIVNQDSVTIFLEASSLAIKGQKSGAQSYAISGAALSINGHSYVEQIDVLWEKGDNGRGQLVVVLSLPLDEYVMGTVAMEVPSSWPVEALAAQAIVARTYAVWKKYQALGKNYHMGATVLDQVYAGLRKSTANLQEAVKQTQGEVIVYTHKPIEAYFHSSCGDQTAKSKDVWGTDIPYLKGGSCGFCRSAPKYRWTRTISRQTLANKLNEAGVPGVSSVTIPRGAMSERPSLIGLESARGKKMFSPTKLRSIIGYNEIPSAWITDCQVGRRNVIFSGRGYGHGVGMCQWGAYGMAKAGYHAKDIIEKYYPGTEIRRMY